MLYALMIPITFKKLLRIIKSRTRSMILYSIMLFLAVLFVGAFVIYLVEHGHNPGIKNYFDALWFIMETITTVGYGDIVPTTTVGRVADMIIMPLGISIISILTASIASAIMNSTMMRASGLGAFSRKNHLLIVGWNDRVPKLIYSIKAAMDQTGDFLDIVIISNQEKPPLPGDVIYIRGNPFIEQDLIRAGADNARTIIVVPLDFKDPSSSDAKVTLITMIIKQLNPNAYIISEVLDESNVNHVKRAGANTVISSGSLSTMAIAREAIYGGVIDAIMELLMPSNHGEIITMPSSDFIGSSFLEAMMKLKSSLNYILIGIDRGGKPVINPPGNMMIERGDGLIVIRGLKDQ